MNTTLLRIALPALLLLGGQSCHKLDDPGKRPDITALTQGFRSSAAVGYCASLAVTAFSGETLPSNVTFSAGSASGYTGSGVLHVSVSKDHPIPFNAAVGDIYIAGLWDGNAGVISVVFGNFDMLSAEYKFYGLYTVPVSKDPLNGEITTVFAEQDIIIGQGSDTLLNLSLTKPVFNEELLRLDSGPSLDEFVLVKQNVWFVTIDQNNSPAEILDDDFRVTGGGQILSAGSSSGGILYHALINVRYNYSQCSYNPTSGTAFLQNLQATGSSIDLGNLTMSFHNTCDGRAQVMLATGKYIGNNGQIVSLNWK